MRLVGAWSPLSATRRGSRCGVDALRRWRPRFRTARIPDFRLSYGCHATETSDAFCRVVSGATTAHSFEHWVATIDVVFVGRSARHPVCPHPLRDLVITEPSQVLADVSSPPCFGGETSESHSRASFRSRYRLAYDARSSGADIAQSHFWRARLSAPESKE